MKTHSAVCADVREQYHNLTGVMILTPERGYRPGRDVPHVRFGCVR